MSKIQANQIQHTQNGAAVFTLPTSDGSTGQVLKSDGSGNLSFVNLPAGGLSEIDVYRVHTTFQGGANPITSNWERFDTQGEDKLGTGMSQSSGVFTFPSTGYYEIIFHSNFYSGGDHQVVAVYIKVSTDGGSSYTYNTDGYGDLYYNSGNGYQSAQATQILKVTDTSNYKLTFATGTASSSSVYFVGGSTQNMTYVVFKKLADI